jgi:hypothetical protein
VRRARRWFKKGTVVSIKSKVLAAAGIVTLAGTLSAVGTTAGAATRQCGPNCVEVYSAKYATPTSLGFAETVFLGNPAHQPYTPIILQHLMGNPTDVPANELRGAAFGPVS